MANAGESGWNPRRPPTHYRATARSWGDQAWRVFAILFMVPVVFVAFISFVYVSIGISNTQNLNETKRLTAQELLRVSQQRETLLPEPEIVARIGLRELSRTSWISCTVSGHGLGLGTTEYHQSCYLTRYIYLDPGPGLTSAKQFDWAAGRTSSYGCEQRISPQGVEESIVFYPSDCARATAPTDAMAIEGDAPGPGVSVVSVRSLHYVSFMLGCRPFSILCDPPVSEPIRI